MPEKMQLNILDGNSISINQDFIFTPPKENIESINPDKDKRYKIIKFSSQWTIHDILLNIPKLSTQRFPNLFIFIIDDKNFGFYGPNFNQTPEKVELLRTFLFQFYKNRPIILQLTSCYEDVTKVYYKEANFEDWMDVEETAGELCNFSSFLSMYLSTKRGNDANLKNLLLKNLSKVENSSLILRFLRILETSEDFFDDLVIKCAAEGSSSDLLAAIDGYIDENGKIECLNPKYLKSASINSTSVLLSAVQNKNTDVINFLLKNCTNLIQQLSLSHQIKISTAAFETNQFEVLSDLLQISDFPFPDDINLELVTNAGLLKIIEARNKFHEDILAENLIKIVDFVIDHPNLKFAYNLDNESAFCNALYSEMYKAFFLLKSLGFEDREIEDYEDELEDDEERMRASNFAWIQKKKNVNFSSSVNKEVTLLSTRTVIFRRYRNSESAEDQSERIMNWYKEIYNTKFGSRLIDAASQCDKLKIIFDFEYKSVDNVDVAARPNALGMTYPLIKNIFIGAKSGDEGRTEQEIKGTIVHEICHYVMRLVYQNKMNPYYNDDDENREKFCGISNEIKLKLFPKVEQNLTDTKREIDEIEDLEDDDAVDDECEEIISSVYSRYPKTAHHLELIVRPAHIQAQFDNDNEKMVKLEELYEKLFDYFRLIVIPELEKFNLKQRENVKNFNKFVGLLLELRSSDIEFVELNDMSKLTKNQLVIATVNVPKLLLLNIFKYLDEKYENLLELQNVFITPKSLESSYIYSNFKQILKQKSTLNIFVDCSKGIERIFEAIPSFEGFQFIFIASNEKQCEELSNKLEAIELVPSKVTINYNWTDLTAESQQILLQAKINFQNNSTFSLSELMSNEHQSNEDFPEIMNDQLFNLLIEGSQISINSQIGEEFLDKNFKILFQTRNFVKNSTVSEPLVPFDGEGESTKHRNMDGLQNSKHGITGNKKIIFRKIKKSEAMTQEEMLEDAKNKKFVLISDKAGSGKSWIFKNFTHKLRKMYPKKWTTYVDLKQFIKEFKPKNAEFDFPSFMTEKILKPKNKYEAEIFKKLYKNGKVCIFFDGFDEIAPDCAEFVTKLFESFQQNGQNQLWIATRDYFEANLKEKLKLDAVYKLDGFTEDHGVDLIATSWVLSEIEEECQNLSENEVANKMKEFPGLKTYKEHAEKLNKRILTSKKISIGLPLFYKIIAIVSKNNEKFPINFGMFRLFKECMDMQYKRWSDEKGELRKNESIESQHKDLNYHRLHQLVAMQSIFPDDSTFCDLDWEDTEDWTDEEIIACGLLIKKGEKFFFSHETFREFYAAEFILRILTKRKMDENLCRYFIKFLTTQKYEQVRMFLDEAIGEQINWKKIEPKIPKLADSFCENVEKIQNLFHIFEENLENLADLLIKIFKIGNVEQIKIILCKNRHIGRSAVKNENLFAKLQDFIIIYFNGNELREFVVESKMLLQTFDLNLRVNTIKEFIWKIQNKTDSEFINKALQMVNTNEENLFFYLVRCKDLEVDKIQAVFQILEEYLSDGEIIKLAMAHNCDGVNVLHACFEKQSVEKLRLIWTELKQLFSSKNSSHHFRALFCEKQQKFGYSLLHSTICQTQTGFDETLWDLLLNIFENREELKILMMEKDKSGDNFVCHLVAHGKWHKEGSKHVLRSIDSDIIEFTFRKLKETFDFAQYQEILRSKGRLDRNLLQIAACKVANVDTHKSLWKIFQDSCKSDEFLDFLKEVDRNGSNVFHLVATFSTKEIFEFMIEELEKIASREEIRKILSTFSFKSKNLLQHSVDNESLEFHENLWKIIRKYFDSSEVLDMVRHADDDGNNILFNSIEWSTKEVVEFTWNEIKAVFNEIENAELKSYIKCLNTKEQNIFHILVSKMDDEKLKFFWKELESSFKCQNISHQFKELLGHKALKNSLGVLHFAVLCDRIKFHETLWELLLKTFENLEELMELMLQKGENEANFVHFITIYSKVEIIDFTFKMFKENFDDLQYQEILRSKGFQGRNLLQIAACSSKDIKKHQILWKIYRDSCKSAEEFLGVLKEVDIQNGNVFHLTAAFSTSEIFEFLTKELEKVASHEELRKILTTLNEESHNLLNSAAIQNKSLQFHQNLWKILQNYFDPLEILNMIDHTDENGSNLIVHAVKCNIMDIVVVTWNRIRKILIADDYFDEKLSKICNECQIYLIHFLKNSSDRKMKEMFKTKWDGLVKKFRLFYSYKMIDPILNQEISIKDVKCLHRLAPCDKIDFHTAFWEILLNTFEDREELKKLMLQKDEYGDNFIQLLIHNENPDIIEFTFSKFKENFNDNQNEEILKSKGIYERNLFQLAATSTKDVKSLQILWKSFQFLSKSDEELFTIFKQVDSKDDNVLYYAINCETGEILIFMIEYLKEIACHEDIKLMLKNIGSFKQNLLQAAAENNKSVEFHTKLWDIFSEYLNSAEICELINHCDRDGDRLIHNVVAWNTKEIVELTWKQIKNFLATEDDQIEYLKTKGHHSQNLLELSSRNNENDKEVRIWVENLMSEYDIFYEQE